MVGRMQGIRSLRSVTLRVIERLDVPDNPAAHLECAEFGLIAGLAVRAAGIPLSGGWRPNYQRLHWLSPAEACLKESLEAEILWLSIHAEMAERVLVVVQCEPRWGINDDQRPMWVRTCCGDDRLLGMAGQQSEFVTPLDKDNTLGERDDNDQYPK